MSRASLTLHRLLIAALSLIVSLTAASQQLDEPADTIVSPLPEVINDASAEAADSTERRVNITFIDRNTEFADSLGIIARAPKWARRYLSTLIKGNIDRTHEKAIDMSFAVTPSYTREAGFGIGGAMTALYRIDRKDSIQVPSDIFASINASLNGFYVLTIKGNNLFPNRRSRLSYKAELYRKHLDFWGINSEETAHNQQSVYDRYQADLYTEFVHRIAYKLFIGAHLRADYTAAREMRHPSYLLGEKPQFYVTGLGISLQYDTRDNILNPTRGVFVAYKPTFYWKALATAPHSFFNHTFILDTYFHMWQGAVLACDFYASITTHNAPWTMREMIASDGIRMRGYYMGSYIDNRQVTAQVEYRQHVYKRLGFTLWYGQCTLFASPEEFRRKDIRPEWLPNFGVGLRFEFKHNVNARIDYGFGRNTSGILFAIGEAF